MSTPELLYVIVPCLNEEGTIGPVVHEVLEHAPRLPMPLRMLLVDDASTDGTRQRMERLAAEHVECDVMSNPQNLGMGRSVMNAYERIPGGAWVTVFPGDRELIFGPSLDNFMQVRDRFDVILGHLQNPVIRPIGRRIASHMFTKVTSTLYGFRWLYLNGLKMYRVEAFRGIEVVSKGHAFMAELLAKAQLRRPELRIGEAPFLSRGRGTGTSKAIRPQAIVRAVREVYTGARSVSSYREQIVKGGGGGRS